MNVVTCTANADPVRGNEVLLRPIADRDRDALASFFAGLSARSLATRFHTGGFRMTASALDALMCRRAAGRAFVAVEGGRLVGHAMWAATRRPGTAEIAFVVAEDRRRRGIGSCLAGCAVAAATHNGMQVVEALVLADNHAARRVVERLLPQATSAYAYGEIAYEAPLAGAVVALPRSA